MSERGSENFPAGAVIHLHCSVRKCSRRVRYTGSTRVFPSMTPLADRRPVLFALGIAAFVIAFTTDERVFGLVTDGQIMTRTAYAMSALGEIGIARGHERIGIHNGRLPSQRHTVLGVLDRAPGGSCEAGPGLVEAVHDQEGLRHAPPGELGSRSLEQS